MGINVGATASEYEESMNRVSEARIIEQPENKWYVEIPDGSSFGVYYTVDLTLWQRIGFWFMGWGVYKIGGSD